MRIRELTHAEWVDILKQVPAATFFERPEWYRIWTQYLNAASSTFLIDDDILVSLIKLRGAKGLIEFRNSGPAGTYSNLQSLSRSQITLDRLKQIISALKISQIRLSPFYDMQRPASTASDQHTQLLDLNHKDDPSRHWSRNHQRQLHKAQDQSLKIRKAKREDWLAYHALYEAFLRRKGDAASNEYKLDLFRSMAQLSADDCSLWLAENDDQILAGKIVLYQGAHAVEWHGVSAPEAARQGVNQLLVYEIINDAKARGVSVYDFNPSGGHAAVEDFKAKFGAKSAYCPVVKNYRPLQQMYLNYTG